MYMPQPRDHRVQALDDPARVQLKFVKVIVYDIGNSVSCWDMRGVKPEVGEIA